MSSELNFSGFHPDDYNFYAGDGTFALKAEVTKGKPPLRGYANMDAGKLLQGGISEDEGRFGEDIAQSRFFTMALSEIKDRNGAPIVFATGEGVWSSFLPVKNINFAFTSYDNLSIPFAALGDIPVLQRKKISTISVTCYDIDDDRIERAMHAWENRCFPKNKYVSYLEDITSELIYKSYDVKGVLNYTRTLYVIPAGGVQVNRGYDVNDAKLITFSVAAVGEKGYAPGPDGYKRN